jgi:hypothetical protein
MSYYRFAFRAPVVIHRMGDLRYRVVFLPAELEAPVGVGGGGRVRLTGEIAERPVELAWQPAVTPQGRRYYVLLSARFCRDAALAVGDLVEVRFNVADPEAVVLADELAAGLRSSRAVARAWAALTPGRQRALAAFVASARTVATRERRVQAMIDALADGRDPLPRPMRRWPAS